MTVCMAQLYIGNECHGVHAFLVPIRCKNTHTILPGIVIGDMGPKVGLDGIDNGWVVFKNARVPYDNLLNKYSNIVNGE